MWILCFQAEPLSLLRAVGGNVVLSHKMQCYLLYVAHVRAVEMVYFTHQVMSSACSPCKMHRGGICTLHTSSGVDRTQSSRGPVPCHGLSRHGSDSCGRRPRLETSACCPLQPAGCRLRSPALSSFRGAPGRLWALPRVASVHAQPDERGAATPALTLRTRAGRAAGHVRRGGGGV